MPRWFTAQKEYYVKSNIYNKTEEFVLFMFCFCFKRADLLNVLVRSEKFLSPLRCLQFSRKSIGYFHITLRHTITSGTNNEKKTIKMNAKPIRNNSAGGRCCAASRIRAMSTTSVVMMK